MYENCVLLGDLNIVRDNTQLQNCVLLDDLNIARGNTQLQNCVLLGDLNIARDNTQLQNCVLLGDLIIVRDNAQLQNFCQSFLFEHLIKKPTCHKRDTPTDIDHIIINIPKRFMKSRTLETVISDHHKMIMTIFRSLFAKSKPKAF